MTLGGKWQFANFCEDVNQKQRRVAEQKQQAEVC